MLQRFQHRPVARGEGDAIEPRLFPRGEYRGHLKPPAAGGYRYMWCLRFHCVVCGSKAFSSARADAISMTRRLSWDALGMKWPAECRAGARNGHQTCVPLCPPFVCRSGSSICTTEPGGVLRRFGGSTTSTVRSKRRRNRSLANLWAKRRTMLCRSRPTVSRWVRCQSSCQRGGVHTTCTR